MHPDQTQPYDDYRAAQRGKWYVVPNQRPDGLPATMADVVDEKGEYIAHFERIVDAEAAVAAVNNATGERNV